MKNKEMFLKIWIPLIILITLFTFESFWIIIYNKVINNQLILIASIIWLYIYLKSFSTYLKTLWSIFIITFWTLFIHLNLLNIIWYLKIDVPTWIVWIQLFLILSVIVTLTIKLLESKDNLNIRNITQIIFSYILTIIFINSWFTFIFSKYDKPLETKCINELCVDLHLWEFKYYFLTTYYYNKDYPIFKFNWKSTEAIYSKHFHKDFLSWNQAKTIAKNSVLKVENWNYTLEYLNIKWDKKVLIINK